MDEKLFTLRKIPYPFRSVLLEDPDGVSSNIPWDLDVRRHTHHPCDFGGVPAQRVARDKRLLSSRRRKETTGTEPVSHSAERVANAIVLATRSPRDLRTLNAWGQCIGVSRGALRAWCKVAGVSARSSLDFLRLLRAIVVSERQPWDLSSILDVVDQRSLVQLLNRGNVRKLCQRKRPTVDEFLKAQRFIKDRRLREAVVERLATHRA